jgi:hypothetical protein
MVLTRDESFGWVGQLAFKATEHLHDHPDIRARLEGQLTGDELTLWREAQDQLNFMWRARKGRLGEVDCQEFLQPRSSTRLDTRLEADSLEDEVA